MIMSLNMAVFEHKYCRSVLKHFGKLMVTIKAKSVQVYNMNGKWNIVPYHFSQNSIIICSSVSSNHKRHSTANGVYATETSIPYIL